MISVWFGYLFEKDEFNKIIKDEKSEKNKKIKIQSHRRQCLSASGAFQLDIDPFCQAVFVEIVITGSFHDVNLVKEILLHRLIDQTTHNILRTENVQQAN